ncbi:hypothetical protein U14_01061 [Candidatus Moduliflexus flocculans]|uniref:Uncharacterized protein n=1 Tax=Candidatus Moduliflexus flocculans TaxID=1499966 RepID=A0A0S6VR84_9BACT|nr:hypothetical protein U14_01061 [Candidatus Moduliflexus flocculans]
MNQEKESLAEIQRRNTRQFQHRVVCPFHAREGNLLFPALPLRQMRREDIRHFAARQPHIEFNLLRRGFCAADRFDLDFADAGFGCGFDVKTHHVVARRGKCQRFLRVADDLQRFFGGDFHRHVFDFFIHRKNGHRHFRRFVRPKHARQRAEQHQRLADKNRFFRRAERVVLPRHHHDPHLTEILRNADDMRIFRARRQLERAVEAHHRREAVRLFLAAAQVVAAADGDQFVQNAGGRVRHKVV